MEGSSIYRLSVAHVLRIIAPLAIVAGVLWLLVAVTGLSGAGRTILAVATLVLAVAAVVALLRPPRVLTLDAGGYRVALVRGAGVRAASWRDVESVTSRPVGGTASMVVELADEQTTVVPLTLLGARNIEAQREVHERLNQAHGYRRLT